MKVRVGTDLQEVADVRAALDAFGDRYTTRIYTARELAGAESSTASVPQALAARFAAKEAVLKALRAGDRPIDLRDIEIVRTADGAPEIVLHGAAAELAASAGLGAWDVSLSHVDTLATATVVALCDGGSPTQNHPEHPGRARATEER